MKTMCGIFVTGWLIAFLATGCKQETPKKEIIRPVRAIQIASTQNFSERSFPGTARAFNEVNLGFEVGGTVAERSVEKGDVVSKGQVLALLDPRDFQNALNQAKAEMDRARAHRDRIEKAARTGAVAKQELTNAEAKLKVAQAEVRIRQKTLSDSKIAAPFDGIISVTFVENFQRVQPKQQVLRLVDLTRIKFDVNIPESLISRVEAAKANRINIFVRFDAFEDIEIPVEIGEVGAEASETTRTYPVTLYLDQPEGITVMPGMSGKAYGKGNAPKFLRQKGFEVPVTAVFEKSEKSFIWKIDETSMTVNELEVTTEGITNKGILITGDIKAGDWIVTAGVHYLKAGQKIRILKKTGNPDKEQPS